MKEKKAKAKVEGKVVGHIILSRAGYGSPSDCEVSDLAKGRFHVGEHVAIAVKGDCGMKRSSFRLSRSRRSSRAIVGAEPARPLPSGASRKAVRSEYHS